MVPILLIPSPTRPWSVSIPSPLFSSSALTFCIVASRKRLVCTFRSDQRLLDWWGDVIYLLLEQEEQNDLISWHAQTQQQWLLFSLDYRQKYNKLGKSSFVPQYHKMPISSHHSSSKRRGLVPSGQEVCWHKASQHAQHRRNKPPCLHFRSLRKKNKNKIKNEINIK